MACGERARQKYLLSKGVTTEYEEVFIETH